MNLNVIKDNIVVQNIDLTPEISDSEDSSITFLIGRADYCHVSIDDKLISREHASITFNESKWLIQKKTSYGELVINGSPIEKKELISGDTINIGSYKIHVTLPEIKVNTPSPQLQTNKTEEIDDISLPSETKPIIDEPTENTENAQSLNSGFNDLGQGRTEELVRGNNSEIHSEKEIDDLGDLSQVQSNEENEENDNIFQLSENSDESNDGEEGDENSDFMENESDFENNFDDNNDFANDGVGDKTQAITHFAKFQLELFGEHIPYEKFLIEKEETFIGRDPSKCQIILKDPEVSATHSVIRKNNITCTLEDLKSGNGTILNGIRINQSELTNNDEFVIGSTTFTVLIKSDFLDSEKKRLMPVENDQIVEIEEIIEVDADFSDEESEEGINGELEFNGEEKEVSKSLFSKDALKDPQKRKKLLIILIVILGAIFLLSEEDKPKPKKKKSDVKSHLLKTNSGKSKAKQKLKKLKPEQEEEVKYLYELAKTRFNNGDFQESLHIIDEMKEILPQYKNSKQIYDSAQRGLKEIEKEEKRRRDEIEKAKRSKKIKLLVEEASKLVKARKFELSQAKFSQILKLDPENFDVPTLKLEIETWKKEQERIALEKAEKEAERNRKVNSLKPGKNAYLRNEWFKATIELQKFLEIEDMDDDLTQEGTKLLLESKEKIENIVSPLLGKARSLKEGQDLKGAYEVYYEILNTHPHQKEAIKEMGEISEILEIRAKQIYREGLINESLSLFNQAKEKFQEVQQISPTDSAYYLKATKKLNNYLE